MIIVTSLGASTGKIRKFALMRVEHDGEYALVASMGGAPSNPGWYHNLVAEPLVMIQDGPEPHDYVTRIVDGEERATWWERAVDGVPDLRGVRGQDRSRHSGLRRQPVD